MIEFATLSPPIQALVLVSVVLLEAVVLYAGYGVLERLVGPPLLDAVGGR